MAVPTFVDRVSLHVAAGRGGNGVASVHREKFKPLGGPDGGNGGKGGDVVLVVDSQVHTLLDFHFRPNAAAGSGKGGQGANRDGANGADLELRVPDGTVVMTPDGEVVADLVGEGTRLIAAQGGRGGLGGLVGGEGAGAEEGYAAQGKDAEEGGDVGVERALHALAGGGAAGDDIQGDDDGRGKDEGDGDNDKHFHFVNLHRYFLLVLVYAAHQARPEL